MASVLTGAVAGGAILALAAALAAAGATYPARSARVLVDCLGRSVVKPTELVLACGDGTQSVASIVWTGWGAAFTAGRGVVTINDCKPDCVSGRDRSYPVLLLLTGRQRCRPSGPIAYSKLELAFLDRSLHTTATEIFPCRNAK